MKPFRLISAFILLAVASCNHPQIQEKQLQETPKALEDESLSRDLASKRGSGDLVEGLYREMEEKSPELKDLESKLEYLSKTEPDSAQLFDKYNGKNKSYYASAGSHATQIGDSVLREKMKKLIGYGRFFQATGSDENLFGFTHKEIRPSCQLLLRRNLQVLFRTL